MGQHVKFDWAIKRLLRNKANFDILEGFLSELLGFDMRIQVILESEGNQRHERDKFNRVDLLARDMQGELILIEVQNDLQEDYFRRMLYGQAKLISEQLELGDPYARLSKVYSINIVYFPLGVGEDYLYVSDGSFRGMHLGDELGLTARQKELYRAERVREIFTQYYIIKVNQFDDVAKSTLDEWVYFLKHSDIKPTFRAKGLDRAREVLHWDSMTDQEKRDYGAFMNDRRDRLSEYNSAIGKYEEKLVELEGQMAEVERRKAEAEKQKEQAERQKAEAEKQKAEAEKREKEAQGLAHGANVRLALRMLRYGETVEEIVRETGLSEGEIEGLRGEV